MGVAVVVDLLMNIRSLLSAKNVANVPANENTFFHF